ncbi:2Fe-2S iron-sulfur cluster-binding protein [Pirellulaceae bacterium]|nr:2Fe-2S iron-sulfur cluster-binding protein [Pirellulaceae bacterium]
MNNFILTTGIIILLVVTGRILMLIQQGVLQLRFQAEANRLNLSLLETQIASAKRKFDLTSTGWNGYRKFEIIKAVPEAKGIASFYLKPHDGKTLPPFQPGQYLTFQVDIPGREKPVVRCYSLSDCEHESYYRVSIKRVPPPVGSPLTPPGLVSNFFHEQLAAGDIVDVQSPNGNFVFDPFDSRPAVLIAGGIGITPILTMAKSVVASESGRELLIFIGVRNSDDHAFEAELKEIEKLPNCRLITCFADPLDDDIKHEGIRYQHQGRIAVNLLKNYLESTNYDFFICGPPPMMSGLTEQLSRWGVSSESIHSEAFGPASIKKMKPSSGEVAAGANAKGVASVEFSKSGIQSEWDGSAENLLDFAIDNGVNIDSGCRAGNCGTCLVALKSGKINYNVEPGVEPEAGTCLACVAVPDGDVVIDA